MRLILFFVLFSSYSYANNFNAINENIKPYSKQSMYNTSLKAAVSYEPVKDLKDRTENKIIKFIGANKKTVRVYATIAAIAYKKSLSTKLLRGIEFKGEGWKLRPDAQYYFEDKTVKFSINFSKEW